MADNAAAAPRRSSEALAFDGRLTPGMASRRLQVVSHVLQYYRRWGQSPSYGEIAGALGIHRSTARDCVRRALIRGELVKGPGKHHALLPPASTIAVPACLAPDQAAELLAQLRAQGFIGDGHLELLTRTNRPLLAARELDHIPYRDGDGAIDAGRAG